MKNTTVARRYAKALYELAVSQKTTNDVSQSMNNIVFALTSSPELKKVLFNPLIKPEEKLTLIKNITSNKLVLKFTILLARRKRLSLIPVIYDQFRAFCDVAQGIHRVLVKTATTLNDAQKKLIEGGLVHGFGGKVFGTYEVAKELIGGVWIRMGDKVFDATVKGRIDDLRYTLIHSTN